MIENQTKKMNKWHWFQLYSAAIFFDIVGLLALIPDIVLAGWASFLLNIVFGMTFLLWALIWQDKGLGDKKFFKTFGLSWFMEQLPVINYLPVWTGMIYRAKKSYEGGSVTGMFTKTAGVPSLSSK